jgi:hypothetical protein
MLGLFLAISGVLGTFIRIPMKKQNDHNITEMKKRRHHGPGVKLTDNPKKKQEFSDVRVTVF